MDLGRRGEIRQGHPGEGQRAGSQADRGGAKPAPAAHPAVGDLPVADLDPGPQLVGEPDRVRGEQAGDVRAECAARLQQQEES
jgi:hypothetical protein